MSGHNKWSQIKHRKGAEDAKKSRLFAMLGKTITVETRKSAGDRNSPGLRQAIEQAREYNMPGDNIERAVSNGLGGGGNDLEEVLYEAYGPGGGALIIEGITDNKNRTSQEIKHLLNSHGGALAGQGGVLWAFAKTPTGWLAKTKVDSPAETSGQIKNLLTALATHPDIKNVFPNFDQ